MPALTLILKYYGSYYIQGFNPTINYVFDGKYLADINPNISRDMLIYNKLTALYYGIEKVIWKNNYNSCNYGIDRTFINEGEFRKKDKKSIKSFLIISEERECNMKD
ncbi:hypothetical protein PDN49_27165 [Bacillus cereus]|uniref:hypothetical protein n=1 Tax=Bacillus cereus TaxID=1396 RepID=UPI00192DD03B|nr:hypothetical protein [Bacillus cereus]MDA2328242.1 hypothetical protein [Bacillus cereus]MDA2334039.1 hypothetical protein [Bacillus cereus]MDA2358403.1 hypothetical protein [Bacillus cereus]